MLLLKPIVKPRDELISLNKKRAETNQKYCITAIDANSKASLKGNTCFSTNDSDNNYY